MNILRLTLHKKAFEVMVTGEKTDEYRDDSDWIRSRLYDKNGNPRHYDAIEFTNGYGDHRPRFVTNYLGFTVVNSVNRTYSNGLELKTNKKTFVISFDDIFSIQNTK